MIDLLRRLPGWERFLNRGLLGVAVSALLALGAPAARAQESSARITVGGTGLVSLNLTRTTDFGADPQNADQGVRPDFSDSFLLFRLDRQLYTTHRAGMVIGLLFPDADTGLGDVFYNQVNVFYGTRAFRGTLGRTRLENFVLEFPTLREEDLLEYAFVLNGFSNADNSEFSRYGNVVRAEWFGAGGRLSARGQAANWTVTDSEGERQDDFDINAASGFLGYRLPEAVRYSGFIRDAGIGFNSQKVDLPGQEWLHAVSAGLALNLSRHPLRNIELRGQLIYNRGIDGVAGLLSPAGDLGTPNGRALSESTAIVASLRYLRRPYQLDRFQAAATVAYKTFRGTDASQLAVVPNVFFRLGQGVDVGLQYQYEDFSGSLAEALGRRRSHSLKFLFVFSFQSVFNDYFGDRDDILNLEHGYIS